MKHQRRNILLIIFGAILVLPLLAIGILQLGQAYIKSTREERLQTERLVQVMLPVKNVIWEEEGQELWVGDRMFDVASFKIENGNYYLTGVFDDHETEIAGSLLHLIFSKGNGHLLQLVFLLQCFSISLFFIDFSFNTPRKRKQASFGFLSFPSPFQLVLGPPPRQ